jgi:hypothetical protein
MISALSVLNTFFITSELYVNYILFCVLYFYGQNFTVPSYICTVDNCFYSTGVDVKKNVIVAITSDKGCVVVLIQHQ